MNPQPLAEIFGICWPYFNLLVPLYFFEKIRQTNARLAR